MFIRLHVFRAAGKCLRATPWHLLDTRKIARASPGAQSVHQTLGASWQRAASAARRVVAASPDGIAQRHVAAAPAAAGGAGASGNLGAKAQVRAVWKQIPGIFARARSHAAMQQQVLGRARCKALPMQQASGRVVEVVGMHGKSHTLFSPSSSTPWAACVNFKVLSGTGGYTRHFSDTLTSRTSDMEPCKQAPA